MLYSIRDNFVKLFVKNKVKQEELRAELAFKHDKIDAGERDKRVATANDEPYIKVLQVDFESTQPNVGSFELDWNDEFVNMLKQHGYQGQTDEEIVDRWFQTLCRTIGNEQGIDGVASGYVQINRTPDGKTEVS